jgi:hypothetical protein
VIGVVILLFAMAVVMPIGLFLIGAIWSGLTGWVLSDDADDPSDDQVSEAPSSS